jgi:hypothetical protein
MAHEQHQLAGNGEEPTQGVFIGWLGIVLAVVAVLVAAIGLIAGASHGFQ